MGQLPLKTYTDVVLQSAEANLLLDKIFLQSLPTGLSSSLMASGPAYCCFTYSLPFKHPWPKLQTQNQTKQKPSATPATRTVEYTRLQPFQEDKIAQENRTLEQMSIYSPRWEPGKEVVALRKNILYLKYFDALIFLGGEKKSNTTVFKTVSYPMWFEQ